MPTAVQEVSKSKKARGVYVDTYRGDEYWFAEWRDHAGRLVRKRLGFREEMTPRKARKLANEKFEQYTKVYEERMKIRNSSTRSQLEEYAERASFPRHVVARHVTKFCNQIARAENLDDSRSNRPGLQLFADRSDISSREVNRILEDEERISVGHETVDKICCEFGMLFTDFIEESFDWAERKGIWSDRGGINDCWPIGYYSNASTNSDDDFLI